MRKWLNGFVISRVIWRQWLLKIIWMQRLVFKLMLWTHYLNGTKPYNVSAITITSKTQERKWRNRLILWFKSIGLKLPFWSLFRSVLTFPSFNFNFYWWPLNHGMSLSWGIDLFVNGIIRQCNCWWKHGQVFQLKSHFNLAYLIAWEFIDEEISWAATKFCWQCQTFEICPQKGICHFTQRSHFRGGDDITLQRCFQTSSWLKMIDLKVITFTERPGISVQIDGTIDECSKDHYWW